MSTPWPLVQQHNAYVRVYTRASLVWHLSRALGLCALIQWSAVSILPEPLLILLHVAVLAECFIMYIVTQCWLDAHHADLLDARLVGTYVEQPPGRRVDWSKWMAQHLASDKYNKAWTEL